MAQEFHIEFAPRTAVHVENAEPLGEVQVLVERVAGNPTQEQINIAVAEYIEEHPGAAFGISEEVKQALLQIARKIPYIDDDADYYQDLYDALYPPADLLSISAVYTQTATVYDTESLDSLRDDLVVTALYSDAHTETVTDYTLSGTLTEGTSTITVTYGGKATTFNVTVTAKELESIDAVFTQGSAIILTTDTLDSLKQYLVVTAYYTDDTSVVLADSAYTLSGTLTEGTSTITATYKNMSDTFDVTVIYQPYARLLYNWDFTQSMVDTVASQEATLSGDFSRNASGLNMAQTGYCELGITFEKGMAIEVDIVRATAAEAQTQTTMVLQWLADSNAKGLSFGYHGSSTTSNKRWGIIATQDVGHWGLTTLTPTAMNVAQGGTAKTVRMEIADDGTVSMYLNGTYYSTDYEGNPAVISSNDNIKNVVIGGKVTYTVSFNTCIIGACRVYG